MGWADRLLFSWSLRADARHLGSNESHFFKTIAIVLGNALIPKAYGEFSGPKQFSGF